jgi:predicted CoA-substrate-specific enzyme activase
MGKNMTTRKYVGMDIGSTTAKVTVLDRNKKVLYSEYKRHHTNIKETVESMIKNICRFADAGGMTVTVTGSAGTAISKHLSLPYMQEVLACTKAVEFLLPQTDTAIELGGEDAKITFFKGGLEQRMNGTCAGGTGAFIDQMAALLNTDAIGLDRLAEKYKYIYPIASRCGVFAKTDIQPLLNDGVAKEDIAASIFQAVVNQTLSGLACGRPLKGNIAFLGGPLHYLPQLRRRFIETLSLSEEQALIPDDGRLFVAYGAALSSFEQEPLSAEEILERLSHPYDDSFFEVPRLRPLFKNEKEYTDFHKRHKEKTTVHAVNPHDPLECYLGIDSGSTTTKAVLIDKEKRLIKTFYRSNEGSPLVQACRILQDIYDEFPNIKILYSGVTGYGELLIKAALKVDFGEIETVAHAKAAQFFVPDADCIIDIGGQDMKCITVKDGVIDNIMLNEACSSGCGSFLEAFAQSLGMSAELFSREAIGAKNPVDLGSRCTVFMNSRVKQAQKEGATVGDISAGLSYSVIKNALHKVMKVKSPEDLGNRIVVQGGTFRNDAVLRAFEIVSGKIPYRPDIAELTGAFGIALLAMEKGKKSTFSTLIGKEELKKFMVTTKTARCERCSNRCLLTVSLFSDGRKYISGNRCEKGADEEKTQERPSDLYEYRLERFFSYRPLKYPIRGTVGIPRALNMFEQYPFWHVFFTRLGFQTVLSSPSSKKLYEKGLETIPADTVCYPAKLMHGHIKDLIEKNPDYIFYPLLPYEKKEFKDADNCYNCPIVASYSETIKNNTEFPQNVKFLNPCLPFHEKRRLIQRLHEEFAFLGISKKEVEDAVKAADSEYRAAKEDIRKKGEEVLRILEETGQKGIVLSGRPYHTDPGIHHGINRLITQMGLSVLTEDSVAHLLPVRRPLRVLDQWTYSSRLYAAAEYTGSNPLLEFVQLTSFGCGIDSVTADQAAEILQKYGKKSTLLKIDEGSGLGAVRIRLRSLKAVMTDDNTQKPVVDSKNVCFPLFTKEMKKKHTVLAPQMSPLHFDFLKEAFISEGYRLNVLPIQTPSTVETGLKYVHNDSCYPSILIVGQIIEALRSGEYDTDNVSVIITQSGGGCRQSNYYALIRKALCEAGFSHVPIISLSTLKTDTQPGFSFTLPLARKCLTALVYGDLLVRLILQTRPHERTKGSARSLYESMLPSLYENIRSCSFSHFRENIRSIVRAFENIRVFDIPKPKVGIVGEIFAKYNPLSNNNLTEFLEKEGAEVHLPDLSDFFLYCLYTRIAKYELGLANRVTKLSGSLGLRLFDVYRSPVLHALEDSKRFDRPGSIQTKAQLAKEFISLGHHTGEGWLITGEMAEMIEKGVSNILCVQPFACLPNHISGKSVFNAIKKKYPHANLAAVDYDPGASEVNQISRILLMLGNAKKNMNIR